MTDRAATLTYYAMMSLFPALLVRRHAAGPGRAAGRSSPTPTNYLVDHGADAETASVIRRVLQNMVNASGGALGRHPDRSPSLLALNGASGAFGAAGRALNVVYGVEERRGLVRRKLTDLARRSSSSCSSPSCWPRSSSAARSPTTCFGKIGLGSTAATIWSYVRWPVALVAATVAYGIVYGIAPDIEPRQLRWITPGAAVGVGAVDRRSRSASRSTCATSRATAPSTAPSRAAIVLLLWLYLSANAFLFGAELNAELERTRGRRRRSSARPAPRVA